MNHSGTVKIPVGLCVCPECGSQLHAECYDFAKSGKPTAGGLLINCTAENKPHWYNQSDWQSIISKVESWSKHLPAKASLHGSLAFPKKMFCADPTIIRIQEGL